MDSTKYGLSGVLAELTNRLRDFSSHSESLRKLFSPQRLSLRELIGVLQQKNHGSLPAGERESIDCLAMARAAQECLQSSAVTPEEAAAFLLAEVQRFINETQG